MNHQYVVSFLFEYFSIKFKNLFHLNEIVNEVHLDFSILSEKFCGFQKSGFHTAIFSHKVHELDFFSISVFGESIIVQILEFATIDQIVINI